MKFIFDRRSKVEKEIDDRIEKLLEEAKTKEDLKYIIDLVKSREEMHAAKPRVKPDTKWMIFGNLAGMALILGHERLHVISTKALGQLLRWRV